MAVEVFDDHCCSLGEGPLWHPDRQSLLWFDIDNQLMLEKRYGDRDRIEYRFDRTVTAAGLIAGSDHEVIVASERDLFVFDLKTRDQRVLCSLESENARTRSNDGRADPFGGFWIGTMGFNAENEAGAIYRFYRGKLRTLFPKVSIPNAICFAPNGKDAFFTDSSVGVIWKTELDHEGWPSGDPSVFVDLSHEEYAPDGAVCDDDGKLWSAQWMASRVAVYSNNGDLVGEHAIPTSQTTCPAFGGPDGSTLFVTSAGSHLPDPLKGTQTNAGFTFMIKNAGVGRSESRVVL